MAKISLKKDLCGDIIVTTGYIRTGAFIMDIIKKSPFPEKVGKVDFIDEPLVSVGQYFDDRIFIEPVYYNKGISGAISDMKLRKSVVERLENALDNLPCEMTFKIFDAWRPIEVQQALFDGYREKILSEHPEYSDEKITEETRKFVSVPSYDECNPSVHNTGGAVDLTLVFKESRKALDMGTEFDDFSEKAYTCYFEENFNKEIAENRRILYFAMTKAGFTNLPTEWWHYDFGTAFWSFYTGKPAMFKGVLNK